MTTTESDHLLGEGVPVTFADGVHHLRYPMRALKTLEDAFDGDLDNVLRWFTTPSKNFLDRLTRVLAAGLAHEGYDVEKVLDQAIPPKMGEYRDAALAAFLLVLPPPPDEPAPSGKDGAASDGATNGSTGQGSTTPPPSGSAAPTATSGTT